MAKTDAALAGDDPAKVAAIQQRVAAITTIGEAEAYTEEVMTRAQHATGRARRTPTAPPTLAASGSSDDVARQRGRMILRGVRLSVCPANRR
jgi:hypothetical protein